MNSQKTFNDTSKELLNLNPIEIPSEYELTDINEEVFIKEMLIIIILYATTISGGIFIKKLNLKFLNESISSILFGLIGGFILTSMNLNEYCQDLTEGYLKIFIIFLLPWIIFESAFNIKKQEFYKNLGTILIYAVLGTLISIIIIGYFMWYLGLSGVYEPFSFKESIAYGALISATDPVCIISAFKEYATDQNFYLLVFGESILNDAVSMVFYNTIVDFKDQGSIINSIYRPICSFLFILIGSTLIGMIVGFIVSVLLKYVEKNHKYIVKIEKTTFIIVPYFTYLMADLLGMSSIVVIFFIGVSLAIYSKPYMTDDAKHFIHDFYEEVASLSETIVFIFIGIAFMATHPYNKMSFSLPLSIVILCLVGRAFNILICSYLANISRKEKSKIDFNKQFFLWFSGVRGAMAFALAIKSMSDFPEVGSIFLLITLIITAFTLIYSSLFLENTLHRCDIIIKEEEVRTEMKVFSREYQPKTFYDKNLFYILKEKIEKINDEYLLPYVERNQETQGKGLKTNLLQDFKYLS